MTAISKQPKKAPDPPDSLGEVRSQFESLLQAIPDVVYIKDEAGRNRVVNDAFLRLAGRTSEDVIGLTDDEILPPDLSAKCRESDERAIRERSAVRLEEKSIGPDGAARYYETIKAPIFGEEEKIIGLVGVSRDITERKRMEEALRKSLREKEILLKEIHHRVKNNMQIISSLLNLQAKTIRDPAALEGLAECQNRIHSMALIHEKLYRSKDISSLEFGEYVRSLATALFRTCRADPGLIRLVFETEETFLDIDTAIPCGLIVNELVLNAIKHAFPGGRTGEIRIALGRKERGGCRLAVSDTGIGFPEQADFRKTETLGLHLVMMLVEQIDGTIKMTRRGGTTFDIAFHGPKSKL
jgi:PAS domain S-box-containing protein